MFTQELLAFMNKYNISSADSWHKVSKVSKSAIARALRGENKDIGLNTFLMMITPYGATPDEVLNLGAYSPEALAKDELAEKLESAIETIETSEEIPPETTQEIKNALTEAQEFISTTDQTQSVSTICSTCASLRETIADLTAENELKDKWITRLLHILQSTTEPERKPKKKPKRLAVRKKALTTRRAVNSQSLLNDDSLTDKEKCIVWDYMVNKMSLEEIALKYYEEYIVSPERRAELERIISPYDSSL